MDNTVTLLGYYGGDESHAISAWQSTNLDLEIDLPDDIKQRIAVLFEETQKGKRKSSKELLKMLATHYHYTPFEKSTLHFQIKADIATHIHCLKHRIGVSINSESGRYKELKDKWLIPEDWKNEKVKKDIIYDDGLFIVEQAEENFKKYTWGDVLDSYSKLGHFLYHTSLEELEKTLGRKRAKESARFFLPYSKQLDYDMMFNFRSFYHFYNLRGSSAAQKEVQYIASEMLRLIKEIPGNPFKETLEAFNL